ncbi:MAG: T9SS type A sorting domain-containing protein [bacterium]|nr:T9SS type A sorting domain-containing protein [bacterium]
MNTKIKITLLVLSMVAVFSANAQWSNQSVTKLPYVNTSCVVNKQLCFALSGVCLYRSTDGGKSWQMDSLFHPSKTIYLFEHATIKFVSANMGFIYFKTEEEVYVFKTTNQGKTWERQILASELMDYQLKINSELEWLAYSSKVLKTTNDGGITWKEIKVSNDTNINNVEIIDTDWYVLTSNDNSMVNINMTSNQGASFTFITQLQMETDTMFQIASHQFIGMVRTKKGITFLYNIYYSGCGSYYDHSKMYYLYQGRYSEWHVADSLKKFNYIPTGMFLKNDTGYMVGSLSIYKTTDGGRTWLPVHTDKDYSWGSFESIEFVNGNWWANTSLGGVFTKDEWSADQNLKLNTFTKEKLKLFPNPANDYINCQIKESVTGCVEFIITNMNGQGISNEFYNGISLISYNTSALANGIYTYTLKYNNQIQNGTFTISR